MDKLILYSIVTDINRLIEGATGDTVSNCHYVLNTINSPMGDMRAQPTFIINGLVNSKKVYSLGDYPLNRPRPWYPQEFYWGNSGVDQSHQLKSPQLTLLISSDIGKALISDSELPCFDSLGSVKSAFTGTWHAMPITIEDPTSLAQMIDRVKKLLTH